MANKYTKLDIDITRAIKLYEEGMTQIEVGLALGTTQKVIYARFKEIGYKCRIAKKRNQFGNKNHMWKGNDVSYQALHIRVEKRKGKPSRCEICGCCDKNKTYEWCNTTGNYYEINDYKRMCRKCHRAFDKKTFNSVGYNQYKRRDSN